VAAAHAVLDVIEEEQLCQRAEQLGRHLKEVLNQAREHCPAIVDIRGQGSMVAVEFNDPQTGAPSPEFTRHIQQKAQENGLLLLSCGVYGNVIRFLYPLTIPDAQFTKALDILARILRVMRPTPVRRPGSQKKPDAAHEFILSVSAVSP
jgi:4-aminobutyrate aminotransferase